MANDPPALPPRVPIYNKSLSSQSCRQPRSRSSDNRSLGSDISPEAPSTQALDNTLDVFIPLSSDEDEQTLHDGVNVEADIADHAGAQKRLTINSSEAEQTAFENVSAECREYPNNGADDSLDVVVGTDDETDNDRQLALNSSELTGFSDNSREYPDVSEEGFERSSRRTRPNVSRRLTRKETTKLSRKLTRKMSCRQQHALMMASEFDEFDELDVVVETGDVTDDDDDDDGKLSAVVSGSKDKNGDGLRDVDNADSIDTSFDQRVTTKLQYDQLQVIFM